jgi:hypothetical protein
MEAHNQRSIMSRYLSWLVVGIAAAFLVVASAAFSTPVIAALAFAISIGTLVVSGSIAYRDRSSVATVYTAALVALVSAWTIVASLVFSDSTVQHLALASSLAVSGLTLVGLTVHEVSTEHAVQATEDGSTERDTRLAAAA